MHTITKCDEIDRKMAASVKTDYVEHETEGVFQQELELLQEIFIHEIEVKTENGPPYELIVTLHPATADRTDLQYVTLTLVLRILKEYPDVVPEILIKNPRGLSEEEVASLLKQLQDCTAERSGEAMLYDLIVMAKESLTANNTPSCPCVICYHNFEELDQFTKTRCYHYFHNSCLSRYIKYAQENEEPVVCPVCRETLPEMKDLASNSGMTALKDPLQFTADQKLRAWQREMAALKKKQAEQGGIIDLVANSNKFLLDISSTPSSPVIPASIVITPKEQREVDKNGAHVDEKDDLVKQREDLTKQGVTRNSSRQSLSRPPSSSEKSRSRDRRHICTDRGTHNREDRRRDGRSHSGRGGYQKRQRGDTSSAYSSRDRERNHSSKPRGDRKDGKEKGSQNNHSGTKSAAVGKGELKGENRDREEGFNFYGEKEKDDAKKESDGDGKIKKNECEERDEAFREAAMESRIPSSSKEQITHENEKLDGGKSDKELCGVNNTQAKGKVKGDGEGKGQTQTGFSGHGRRTRNEISSRQRRTRKKFPEGNQNQTQNVNKVYKTSTTGKRDKEDRTIDATVQRKEQANRRGQWSDGSKQQRIITSKRVEAANETKDVSKDKDAIVMPSSSKPPPGLESQRKPRPPPGFEDFR